MELMHTWEKPGIHWTTVGGIVSQVAQKFGVIPLYCSAAFLHDTPIPFQRLTVSKAFEWPPGVNPDEVVGWYKGYPVKRWLSILRRIPFFEVVIYDGPVTSDELRTIERLYNDFLKYEYQKLDQEEPRDTRVDSPEEILVETKGQIGAHVVGKVINEGVARLQIRSYAPYATPNELVNIIKRAMKANQVGASANALGAIRTWTAYLLTKECNFSNREAIRLWNERLGESSNYTYAMADLGENQHGVSVTSSGEIQFSREKKALTDRIEHYRKTLTRRRPAAS